MADDLTRLDFMDPGASTYTFTDDANLDIWFEHLQVRIPIGSGRTKSYHRKFKVWVNLTWQQPRFLRGTQYGRLREIFNLHTGITIYPFIDSRPGACYAVEWINDFDLHLVAGSTPYGYNGRMLLEGTSILTEVDSNVVQGLG
jgi:hypothetical protein